MTKQGNGVKMISTVNGVQLSEENRFYRMGWIDLFSVQIVPHKSKMVLSKADSANGYPKMLLVQKIICQMVPAQKLLHWTLFTRRFW